MRISDWSSDVCSSDLDGEVNRRADREEPGIPTVEVVELEGFDADSSPQADPWIEVSFGDADGRRRSMELGFRSEEHTSELQSLMRISYAVFCLKKKTIQEYRHAKRRTVSTYEY